MGNMLTDIVRDAVIIGTLYLRKGDSYIKFSRSFKVITTLLQSNILRKMVLSAYNNGRG